jgi:hypothetical protein
VEPVELSLPTVVLLVLPVLPVLEVLVPALLPFLFLLVL